MTDPHRHRDAAHAAEEPGVLSEYGNDTGFAAELLGIDVLSVEVHAEDDTSAEDDDTGTDDIGTEDH
jgi:hypothetical protein